jgi:hypothetical protein
MTQEKNNSSANGGVGVLGVIQIVFIILKCINNKVIGAWPWWKVLLPTIIGAGIMVCVCCCGIGIVCAMKTADEPNKVDDTHKLHTIITIPSTNSAFDNTVKTNEQVDPDSIV